MLIWKKISCSIWPFKVKILLYSQKIDKFAHHSGIIFRGWPNLWVRTVPYEAIIATNAENGHFSTNGQYCSSCYLRTHESRRILGRSNRQNQGFFRHFVLYARPSVSRKFELDQFLSWVRPFSSWVGPFLCWDRLNFSPSQATLGLSF